MQRLRAGVFVVPEVSHARRQALLHGGVLACVSAAQELGLWVMPFEATHVWLTASGHERVHDGCNCFAHWHEASSFERSRPRMPIVLALKQIALCLGGEPFFVALESALNQKKLDQIDLAELRNALPASFGLLCDLAESTAESGLESILRYRLHKLGISVLGQVMIPGVGRVDLVIGDCLIVEADGRENHAGIDKRHKDLVRDAVAASLGLDTLRFDYALIVHDWPMVEAAILGRLARGGHETVAGLRMRAATRG